MPNTYTQIFIHLVFAVKYREALIDPSWKSLLHKYITGIVKHQGHKLIAINSMPDHIHIFIGMKPHTALSDLVRDVKARSTVFVNQELQLEKKFAWQEGFGAFSYSQSQIDRVVKYILNQEHHHARKSFGEEYTSFLQKFQVDHDSKYVFNRIG